MHLSSSIFSQKNNIYYHSKHTNNNYYTNELYATLGDSTYILIDSLHPITYNDRDFSIWDIRDYNNDGLDEILIAYGLDGPSGYIGGTIIFSFQNKHFNKLKLWGGGEGGYPSIKKWKGLWSINFIDYDNSIFETFVLRRDSLVSVFKFSQTNSNAPSNAKFDINNSNLKFSYINPFLFYDLDSDGKQDTINGHYWDRWHCFNSLDVVFANGQKDTFPINTNSEEVSILRTKTKGVYDIMSNSDLFIWNGTSYEKQLFIYHQVQKGEYLGSIAKKHKTTIEALMTLNGKGSDQIKVGEYLKIPQHAENYSYYAHVVLRNETLWSIGNKYGVSVEAIQKENNLNGEQTIQFGKIIKIPMDAETYKLNRE